VVGRAVQVATIQVALRTSSAPVRWSGAPPEISAGNRGGAADQPGGREMVRRATSIWLSLKWLAQMGP